jgi:hypothetical protein
VESNRSNLPCIFSLVQEILAIERAAHANVPFRTPRGQRGAKWTGVGQRASLRPDLGESAFQAARIPANSSGKGPRLVPAAPYAGTTCTLAGISGHNVALGHEHLISAAVAVLWR